MAQDLTMDFISENKDELFMEIPEEIENDNITDIEWDGYNLWLTDLKEGCYRSEKKLSDEYVENLTFRLGDRMGTACTKAKPILEANTDQLRISVWHESRTGGKKSVTIRKIPMGLRFNHLALIESKYAPEPIIDLLENCVTAHMNVVIGGMPGAGKTELLKYLTTFIPAIEKAGVYEDNAEIHYREINPNKKCSPLFIDEKFSYSEAISAGLRHDIDWILLSEARGPEVQDLVNALSTGSNCMTTMHLDHVSNIPDRMCSMLGGKATERFVDNAYRYIDVGVMVECDKHEHRKLTQLCFFTRTNGNNKCTMIYDNGEFTNEEIPEEFLMKLTKYGIEDPYAA